MIRVALFLVLLLNSLFVFAEATVNQQKIIDKIEALNTLNQSLLALEDDAKIDALLTAKNTLLKTLVEQLQTSSIDEFPTVISNERLNLLITRINVNKERNNKLAMARDTFKQEFYQTQKNTRDFLTYLIHANQDYKPASSIVHYAKNKLSRNIKKRRRIKLPPEQDSPIYLKLEQNYRQFRIANDSYQDILHYCINNSEKVSVIHWTKYLSLSSMIAYINHFEFIRPINHKLSTLKVDTGGILLSFIIVLLVYLCHPFVFKFTSWIVESYVLEAGVDHQELIYHEIRTPLRSLVIFFGLDLAMNALFYRVDYRVLVEGIVFAIYAFIYVWFFFKLLDSIALLQIRKLSRTNKALRKELFNLAIQVIKAIMLIVVVTISLKHFGVNISAIISTLGLGGLAFALAAKDTLSNLFGGITILFDNIFKMGDWVKIGDTEGTVAEIGLRSTTIRTFDNALITIPNASVSVSSVKNWNRRSVGRRIKMYIGVTYESDMTDIRQALDDIRDMLQNHKGIANPRAQMPNQKRGHFKFSSQADTYGIKNTQLVFMDRYNDFSIDILIYCFSKSVAWEEWLRVKEDVLFKIADILAENNLEFAYPTEVNINRGIPNISLPN
ncbi:MAG: mechanosensitive ion channel family protein [Methylococcales bacterium]|nr:mechanosensitive ion channel family protein [Methylococcales bacterium]